VVPGVGLTVLVDISSAFVFNKSLIKSFADSTLKGAYNRSVLCLTSRVTSNR
jgi:hypothetical protein